MTGDFKMKGSTLRSKFDFVRERFGADGENRLRENLKDVSDLAPLLDSNWYSFRTYLHVVDAIVALFFEGRIERLREVGEFSAEKALTGVYRAFASGGTFANFVKRMEAFHATIYSTGFARVVVSDDGNSFDISLGGLPEYSRGEAEINTGYLAEAARRLGHPRAKVSYRMAGDGASFSVTL